VYSESTKTTTSLPIQTIILGFGHLAYCSKYMLNSPQPIQKKFTFFAQYCRHIYHSYILSGRFPLSPHALTPACTNTQPYMAYVIGVAALVTIGVECTNFQSGASFAGFITYTIICVDLNQRGFLRNVSKVKNHIPIEYLKYSQWSLDQMASPLP
jgi:hypothetical protein